MIPTPLRSCATSSGSCNIAYTVGEDSGLSVVEENIKGQLRKRANSKGECTKFPVSEYSHRRPSTRCCSCHTLRPVCVHTVGIDGHRLNVTSLNSEPDVSFF
jgi:hypothetical protein